MPPLKNIRIVVAILFFLALSALFLDFSEIVPRQWHALAHLQLTPALLGHIAIVLVLWFGVTLLFGRIYCSTVCPFGVLQDLLIRIAKWVRGKKFEFQFRPEMKWTRYTFLGLFIVGLACLPVLIALLDPYSHFGRVMTWMFRPLLIAGNNVLAGNLGGQFHFVPNYISGIAFLITVSVFLFVATLAMFAGRRYCNTICPIGTLLGIIARYSVVRIRIKENCRSCRFCERKCKGECIDGSAKTIDSSRCVACFNCLSACKLNAIGYDLKRTKLPPNRAAKSAPSTAKTGQMSRRSLLSWSVIAFLLPSSVRAELNEKRPREKAGEIVVPLPRGQSVIGYTMNDPILPPGAGNMHRYRKHCSACHLCITKCPTNVLAPSVTELGLAGFLQPIMKFTHGFCNYDCTICAEVCPSHALRVRSKEHKHRIQVGEAVFLKVNCVVQTQGTACGACAEHCPTGAIKMVPFGKPGSLLTLPEVETELCIGCGACEYICPVTPYRAIYVKGLAKQGEAKPAYDPNEKQQEVKLEDFGF